ncbi:flagellin [Shinella sp.]|uniref:flagellin N-terminal helical domain-containing protein n=1 Tax=Shinella sp. TaxID=1870904 RepID=UPI0029B9A060|nr:flagellin [Shinella sp.]MDX3977010.1 flagellin [Shinella sp.]
MTSILTNASAISALQNLRSISSSLQSTQNQVSSGLRIAAAKDNAAYWSVATTMRSDNMAVSAVQDALGLSASVVGTAYSGMESAIDVMHEIKAKLVAAHEEGVDKEKINGELDQLKDQLRSIAESASFSGQNWLRMTDNTDPKQNGVKYLPASFARSPSGGVSVNSIEIDMTAEWYSTDKVFYLISEDGCDGIITNSGFSTAAGYSNDWVLIRGEHHPFHNEMVLTNDTTSDDLEEMTVVVEMMTKRMTDLASMYGALEKRIEMSEDFLNVLSDSQDKGIGRLVDADMNEASMRLKAIQTQEQLAIQALSIANTSAENIMQLFR